MKIYIGSHFGSIPKVEVAAKALEEEGHEISVKWWSRLDLKKKFELLTDEEFYAEPENRIAYERDFKGVKESDIFLLIADDLPRAYNGANIELGIALSDKKPCFSLNALQKSAMYYPVIKYSKIEEVIEHLKRFSGLVCPKIDCGALMEGDSDGYWCPNCEEYYPPDIIDEWFSENE